MDADTGLWQVADIDDATQVGAARRMAARLAEYAGLDDTRAGQLGLVVVELATNLFKHARQGRLFLRAEGEGDSAVIDVVAVDQGPGMDLERCFRDGFSTGGTSGTGLGAVRRVATLFDAYSDARGSVLFARLGTMPGPRRGSVALAIRGELESGDRWQFLPTPRGWSAAVVDGLGHGAEAARAADIVAREHAAPRPRSSPTTRVPRASCTPAWATSRCRWSGWRTGAGWPARTARSAPPARRCASSASTRRDARWWSCTATG